MKIVKLCPEREDLICLFSDITYSTPFSISLVGDEKEIEEFKRIEDEKGIDIYEEIRADWLLEGGTLRLEYDDGCDDEPTIGDFDFDTLVKRINEAFADDDLRRFVTQLMDETGDMLVGWNLVQYIAYGEVIFG